MSNNDIATISPSSSSVSAPQDSSVRLGRLSRWSFGIYVAGIALSLLLASPFTWMPTAFLKLSAAALCMAVSALMLFFISVKTKADTSTRLGRIAVSLVALLPLAYIISFLASNDRSVALLGGGNEIDTLFFVGLGFVAFACAFLLVRSPRAARRFVFFVVTAILIAVACQYLNIFFGNALLPASLFSGKTANLIGKWNDLGLLTALAALLVTVSIEFAGLPARQKTIAGIVLAVLVLLLVIINFDMAWWLLLGGVAVAGWYQWLFARAERRAALRAGTVSIDGGTRTPLRMWCSAAVVVISLIFIFAGASAQRFLPPVFTIASLEVRPAFSTTMQIDALAHTGSVLHTLFGTGPNTFGSVWLASKPLAVNQTQFWSVDFITGFSVLTTALITAGMFGALAWLIPLLLVLLGLYSVPKMMSGRNAGDRATALGLGLMAAFLWVSTIVYATSQNVALLAFASTGAFLGWLVSMRAANKEVLPRSRRSRVLAILPALIVVLLALCAAFLITRRLVSSSYEQLAALALSQNNVQTAAMLDARSQSLEHTSDNLRLGIEIDLTALQQLVAATPTTAPVPQGTQVKFQGLVSDAIQQGVAAAQLNPADYQPYVALGSVYGFLAGLKVQGAYENARQSYLLAIQRDPTNPALPLLQARLEAAQDLKGNADDVQALVGQSLKLKDNYTDAFLLEEQLAVAQNDLPSAIQATRSAVQSAPDQAPLWFELGLLYYAGNDMTNATPAFEQAVQLVPDYANAKYFLGLAYSKQGRTGDAVKQFSDIQAMNPDNAEVKLILANLEAGRNPFAGATPPITPTPAARAQAPIPE